MKPSVSQKGFTIVELLIVIVIIAIIAAITLISYNGLTLRARNNSRIQSAAKIINLQKAYIAANSSSAYLNLVGSRTNFCLGSNYTDVSSDNSNGAPQCVQLDPNSNVTIGPNQTLNTEILKIGDTNLSGFPKITFDNGGVSQTMSAPYAIENTDSSTYSIDGKPGYLGAVIIQLEGANQDCGFGRQVVYTGKAGNVFQYSTTTGAKNSSYTSTSTKCVYYFNPQEIN